MKCGEDLALVEAQPPAHTHHGLDVSNHTSIQHGDHQGWLVNGKLLCRTGNSEALVECHLDWEAELGCQIVQLLDGHVHSSNCGHEQIPHDDHVDYLVDGRLHHVVSEPSCCKQKCLGFLSEASVVDHGEVSVLKHGSMHPLLSGKDDAHEDEEEIVTSIYAAGICCPSEIPIIHKILGQINGVNNVEVAVMTKTVKVTHFPSMISPAVLVSALNDAGLQASLGARGHGPGSTSKRPPWTVVGSGFFLALSLLSLFSDSLEKLKYAAICATIIGSPFIVIRAWAALKRFILDINVLLIIAVTGAIVIEEYAESAAIVFLFGLAEWLEDRCMRRARTAVGMLSELQPEFAVDAATGTTMPVGEVKVDHLIIIRPGDRVPVDCEVVSGDSAVDESMLTGESCPVPKQGGSELKSGTINSGKGSLKARVTATVESSTIAQVAHLVDEASMQKSKTEKFVERFAKIYTPVVVIGAAALAVIPPMMGRNIKEWVYLSLLLLVTACPCALVVSTPVVTVCGITRAAKKSILIKGGQYLEELARVKAITFDKTGTLTEGRFGVTSVACSDNSTEEEVLSLAAAVEVHSTHPLGPAIAGYATSKGYTQWGEVTGMEIMQGNGIIGYIGGKRIGCGNTALMRNLCPDSPLPEVAVKGFSTVCYISQEANVIGAISVTDTIRPEAKAAITELKKMGVVSAMLTGDRITTGEIIAANVGIDSFRVHAELLPRDKLNMVHSYRDRYGHTAHIGDGINDAPALACSDIGIAMGVGGSALAVEAADIALFSNNLQNLPEAIRISQLVKSKLVQNVVFAVSVKFLVLGLAFTGRVSLWLAVLADVGSSLLVVLNGLMILGLPRRGGHSHAHTCKGSNAGKQSCCTSTHSHMSLETGMQKSCCQAKHGCPPQEVAKKKPCCSGNHGCPPQEVAEKKPCSENHGCPSQEATVKKPCCSTKNGHTPHVGIAKKLCCSSNHECTPQGVVMKKPCCSNKNEQATHETTGKKHCCSGKHRKQHLTSGATAVELMKTCSHVHGQDPNSSCLGPSSSSFLDSRSVKNNCASDPSMYPGSGTGQDDFSAGCGSTKLTRNANQDQEYHARVIHDSFIDPLHDDFGTNQN